MTYLKKTIPFLIILFQACTSESQKGETSSTITPFFSFNYRNDSVVINREFNKLVSSNNIDSIMSLYNDLLYYKSKIIIDSVNVKIDSNLIYKTYGQFGLTIKNYPKNFNLRELKLSTSIKLKKNDSVHYELRRVFRELKSNKNYFGINTADNIMKTINRYNRQTYISSKLLLKQLCDTIYEYDSHCIPNNLTLAEYYRMEKAYNEALDLLLKSDLGVGFDENGELLENYTDEVNHLYGLTYMDKGDTKKAIDHFKLVSDNSFYYRDSQEQIEKLRKSKK